MRLLWTVIGFLLGILLSGLFFTTFMLALQISLLDNNHTFPSPNHRHNDLAKISQCPPWEPSKRHEQVLLVAFHPEKTAGSSMARFFEIQDKENGGNFEMMSPWDETWLLQWLGDAVFRDEHPRVFVHLHGKGAFYHTRAFRRETMLATVQTMPNEVQRIIKADSADPSATGFFEYLTKLLAMHAPRLEKEGARALAVPSWREPGQHFVSGLVFLDLTHNKFRNNKLGVVEHARRALDSLAKGEIANHEYYKPEVLLLYYYGLQSPLVAALHNVTKVEDIALKISQLDTISTSNRSSTDGAESTMSFIEAYKHIYDFVYETRNVTLWSISEKMDQSLILIAHEVGFRLYEEETCLPLWDTVRNNANPLRTRDSMEENIVAGIGRTVISPGASVIHSLVLQAHDAWWNREAFKFTAHQAAISHARSRFANGVPKDIREKRKQYKMFLQKERYPRPSLKGLK